MRELQVPYRRQLPCASSTAWWESAAARCASVPSPPRCADERDDCEQERKALQTTSRPDSCGTHHAIFPSSLRAALTIERVPANAPAHENQSN